MSPTIRSWRCRNPVHPKPCWHAVCEGCNYATAFDHTELEAREIVVAGCTCPSFGGMKITADPAVPPNHFELRDPVTNRLKAVGQW